MFANSSPRWLSFLPAVLLTASVLGAEPASDPNSILQPSLLQRLRDSRLDTQTVAVRFTQTKQLALLDVTLTSEGWIFYQRPESMRYEILSPVRSLLMHDGKQVRNYAFSEGAWKKLRSPAADAIGKVMQQIGHWLQGDFTTGQKMFVLSVAPDEQGLGAIVLTPRDKALTEFIERIELRVEADPVRVTRVGIRETAEDITTLVFRQECHNRALPEGTFTQPEASAACQLFFEESAPSDPNAQ